MKKSHWFLRDFEKIIFLVNTSQMKNLLDFLNRNREHAAQI